MVKADMKNGRIMPAVSCGNSELGVEQMITEITSTKNATYKYLKALQQKKTRMENGVYTVEGIKSVLDAVRAGKDVRAAALADSFPVPVELSGVTVYRVSDNIFGGLCDTKTPQGILAVIGMEREEDFQPDRNGIYIYCDRVADPGNAGTIIRTADAAGMNGVLFSPESVDLYSPKTVRASMGSFFHIHTAADFNRDKLAAMRDRGYQMLCAVLSRDTVEYTAADYTKPTVIILGNEANGISPETAALADVCVKIPILGAAESLNVGIAGAVLMYEAVRQRKI